jgi:2-epi-5-epi-valiolone synthase
MLDELEPNPYEDRTLERLVDFGHTFSGLMEERSDYRLKHGEAVAVDMALSALLAHELGLLSDSDLERVHEAYARLRLPAASRWSTFPILGDAMQSSVAHRGGALNLVVPTSVGEATFLRDASDVPPSALRAALARSFALGPSLERTSG